MFLWMEKIIHRCAPTTDSLVVQPVTLAEKPLWRELMAKHHYLGFGGTAGEAVLYVATIDDRWVALLSWNTGALRVSPREEWIGWDAAVRGKRLHLIANNSRFLILPGVNIKNLASRVLSQNLARLSDDWQRVYGHPIWLAETFVDPARFRGTCYLAANWQVIGRTAGFSRVIKSKGFFAPNQRPKIYLCYPLIRRCRQRLADPYFTDEKCGGFLVTDVSKLPVEGKSGLIAMLRTVEDPRRRQGQLHSNTSVLAISTCAMLSGARNFSAISQWAEELSPKQLQRLRCRQKKPPSLSTIQRVLRGTDANEFDQKVSNWLVGLSQGTVGRGLAVDGKAMRGSFTGDGKPIHLLSALLHEEKIVVSQRRVADKENEISGFCELLKGLDLQGLIVTGDAMHCQQGHAEFLVKEKSSDFLFSVKDNQPSLRTLVELAIEDTNRPICSETRMVSKAHGRIDDRRIIVKQWSHDLANRHAFPYISQIFKITRSWTDLAGGKPKCDTRYFITSATPEHANADELLQCVLEHWAIENSSHYVRDETLGEDRSRIRKGNAPQVMATIRNISIAIIRVSGGENIANEIRRYAWSHKGKVLRAIGV
jgi:predicted transposase YbfD/YdcC